MVGKLSQQSFSLSMLWISLSLFLFLLNSKIRATGVSIFILLIFICFLEEELGFYFYLDKWSWVMILLSSFLMVFISFLEKKMNKIYFFGYFIVSFFFCSNDWVFLYVMFELSLIPLLVSMIYSGVQPERYKAVMYMMMFTLVMSSPLFLSVVFLSETGSFIFSENENGLLLFGLLGFIVKIPVFFFHYWLPRAHVEASLAGSMFLAGILLKMGVFGVFRLLATLPLSTMKLLTEFLYALGMLGCVYSTIMALSSDDVKMSVALSSVSHMNFCVAALMSMSSLSLESAIIIMTAHGLSSPMLFFCVTMSYEYSNSRSILINKGLVSKYPSINGFIFWFWAINICIPPSVGFIGEISGASIIMSFYLFSMIYIFIYMLMNSVFSFLSYGMTCHSNKKSLNKKFISVFSFIGFSLFSTFLLLSMFFFCEMIF
nr:NADH dehydrogenase subunit 4 [Alcedoecus sp.]